MYLVKDLFIFDSLLVNVVETFMFYECSIRSCIECHTSLTCVLQGWLIFVNWCALTSRGQRRKALKRTLRPRLPLMKSNVQSSLVFRLCLLCLWVADDKFKSDLLT